MAELHTDDTFMWENKLTGCPEEDYDRVPREERGVVDPLVNRITHQRGSKVSANVQPNTPNFDLRDEQEQALEELVRDAEELDLYDDQIVHDLTKPLSQQIGGDHYSRQIIQPVEFIHANDLGFCEGNCIKYVCRWKYKGGIQDLEKAKHYIEMLIDMEKAKDDE